MMPVADVLKSISDDKSLVLFNTIALSNSDTEFLIRTLHLTRKQFYARLSALLKAGLVKREMAKYYLTTFGMIIYHFQEIIGKALNQYWKLKAIDSINVTYNGELPQDQFHRIIDTLITDQEIKDILIQQIKERSPKSEEVNDDDMIISMNLVDVKPQNWQNLRLYLLHNNHLPKEQRLQESV